MGYSAQVQQSPSDTSGKAGTKQQMTDATRQAVGNVTDTVQPQGKGGSVGQPAPAYMSPPQQAGMSQADMGINSGAPHQSQGKGGNYSMSATSGQPQLGAPNQYPNTIGIGDNTQIQQLPKMGDGKGKV
jgi:hypothetical protein